MANELIMLKKEVVDKQRILLFLSLTLGVYLLFWIVSVSVPKEIGKTVIGILKFPFVFMGIPILSVIITKKITHDTSKISLSINIFKNPKILLLSTVVPTIAILCGFIIFYSIFKTDIDYSASFITSTFADFGVPENILLDSKSIIIMYIAIFFISQIIAVPSWFIALGEDIGWHGYFLPLLCKYIGVKKAVLLTGSLWGTAHAPLMFWGFNYGDSSFGAPYTTIAMMILFCMTLSVLMSYVTIKSNNCMYAALIHGTVNIVGETGIFISLQTQDTLLGPNPIGIIGLSVLILLSIITFFNLPKECTR